MLTDFLSFSLLQLLSIQILKENIPLSLEMLCQQELLPLAWYNICLTNQREIYHRGFGGVVYGVISTMALNSQMSVVLLRRWNAAAGWEMNECQNLSYKIEDLIWKNSIARILRMCWWIYLIHLFAYFFSK